MATSVPRSEVSSFTYSSKFSFDPPAAAIIRTLFSFNEPSLFLPGTKRLFIAASSSATPWTITDGSISRLFPLPAVCPIS